MSCIGKVPPGAIATAAECARTYRFCCPAKAPDLAPVPF